MVEGDTNTISLTYTAVEFNGTTLTSATIKYIKEKTLYI